MSECINSQGCWRGAVACVAGGIAGANVCSGAWWGSEPKSPVGMVDESEFWSKKIEFFILVQFPSSVGNPPDSSLEEKSKYVILVVAAAAVVQWWWW